MELWRKLLYLVRRGRFDRELDEEMRFHLEMKASAMGDHYAARRQFGNPALLKEVSREVWGWNSLEHLIQDVRYALRMIRRSPGFSSVAILSLALGIGANTAIFSLIDTVMLRMLPVKDPQRLALLIRNASGGPAHSFSYPAVLLFQSQNRTLDGLVAFNAPARVRLATGATSADLEQVSRGFVSGNFFQVLGTNAILGRTFTAEEDNVPGADPYAVLSYNFWKRRFARDPSVIGRRLLVDEIPVTVIGVTPQGFSGVQPGFEPDLWLPAMMMDKNAVTSPNFQAFFALARVKPGVPWRQVQAELDVLYHQHLVERARTIQNERTRAMVLNQTISLDDGSTGYSLVGSRFSKPLLVLMAVVGAVLLIACVNVANLLLARATARQREVSVRLAVGAGRLRLIRQLLTESAVLAALGGIAGLLVAYWGSHVLVAFVAQPGGVVAFDLKPDLRMLAFTAIISLASGLVFGVAPAFRATRGDLMPALKENVRGARLSAGRFSIGKVLVSTQVALSLALLIGGGLFVRSLENLKNLDTGFSRENVLVFELSTPRSYKPPQVLAVNTRVRDVLPTLPGVISSGTAWPTPLSGATWDDVVAVEGYVSRSNEDMDVNLMRTSAGFFETMRTPLLTGRMFGPADTANSPRVALINETMARRFFGGASPVGKHFQCGSCGAGGIEIVGEVRDTKFVSLREPTPATAYMLTEQIPRGGWGAFVARSTGESSALVSALRSELKTIDRNVLLDRPRTLVDQMDEALIQERMIAKLSGFFGLLALLLASIGLYGVMSYAVLRRTNEIGIRMALGANAGDVLRQVLRETMVLVATGIFLGAIVATSVTRFAKTLLFGLTPNDPATIAAMTVLLLVVALLAGCLPARRAAKVDPMVALRYE